VNVNKAFTIIELLLVLVIISIVMIYKNNLKPLKLKKYNKNEVEIKLKNIKNIFEYRDNELKIINKEINIKSKHQILMNTNYIIQYNDSFIKYLPFNNKKIIFENKDEVIKYYENLKKEYYE
jgi:prepilin-type N-terminal cleavage/methylation domain-containing protein